MHLAAVFSAPGRYGYDNLLPAALLVLGGVLTIRLTRFFVSRYRESVEREVRSVVEQGGVASESSKRARAVAQAIEWSVTALISTVVVLLVIHVLGVPLSTLVAPATVVGVALGFGAQQVVGDLLAGFFLFAERQFGVGDLVRLSTPGQLTGISGTVEELTLRVTRLRSQQGELIVVPNSALRQVTNLSRDWSRVVVDLPVPVDEDLEAVIAAVRDTCESMAAEDEWRPLILGDPVVAGIETIEVGYVQLRILVRTQPGRQFDVGRELRLRLATRLRSLGVSAPGVSGP